MTETALQFLIENHGRVVPKDEILKAVWRDTFVTENTLTRAVGEIRKALDTLKNAIVAGHANYEWIKRDPDLDNIRNEPEYVELMKGT